MNFAVRKKDKDQLSSPWEVNHEGKYGALVLRYWGCNLSCFLCYSQSYAYLNEEGGRKKINYTIEQCEEAIKHLSKQVGWARIQGGEPLLDSERAFFTAKMCDLALNYMLTHSQYKSPRLIIQTNGLWIGSGDKKEVVGFFKDLLSYIEKNSKARIAIELSFKGANSEMTDFFADSLNRHSDVFAIQLEAFKRLKDIFKNLVWGKIKNIVFYPVAGIGVELSNPGFIPVFISASGEELPFFHPRTWDNDFKGMIHEFRELLAEEKDCSIDFINSHNTKIPIECIEPSFFQKGWTAQIQRRPELRDFIIKNLRIIKNPKLNLFMKDVGIEEIPIADSSLLSKLIDLKKDFYEAEPAQHYPYL